MRTLNAHRAATSASQETQTVAAVTAAGGGSVSTARNRGTWRRGSAASAP
jgi:hypothetical protein